MINALMTGLGIGIALWIVIIPSMLIIFRRAKASVFETSNAQQERSIKLMEERNELDKETNSHLDQIKISLWNLVEAQLRDKK